MKRLAVALILTAIAMWSLPALARPSPPIHAVEIGIIGRWPCEPREVLVRAPERWGGDNIWMCSGLFAPEVAS